MNQTSSAAPTQRTARVALWTLATFILLGSGSCIDFDAANRTFCTDSDNPSCNSDNSTDEANWDAIIWDRGAWK